MLTMLAFLKKSPEGGVRMKFYTIKLPKFLGGFVKAILNTFSKH
jgi:stage V sporulation protein M